MNLPCAKFTLKIYRGAANHQYWEEFELPFHSDANVISALLEIQKNPTNRQGQKTTPVVWEQACLEEVCGACSMLINGIPRQACTALIRDCIHSNSNVVRLAPLTKFPLIRDLQVDRSYLFEVLKKMRAWMDSSSCMNREQFGSRLSSYLQQTLYPLATCMTCGCCSESCPQVNEKSNFIGPAAIAQVRLFNAHPAGCSDKSFRLQAVLGNDGIACCGNSRNCARVCPKKIPLTESIPAIAREVLKFFYE
jgi:succinate dehydrogenase / fumarate reductase iron-sulfur subunit